LYRNKLCSSESRRLEAGATSLQAGRLWYFRLHIEQFINTLF